MKVPFTLSEDSITVFVSGQIKTVANGHPSYSELKEYLKGDDHDPEEILDMCDQEQFISKKVAGSKVGVKCGTVYYEGTPVHNTLTEQLLNLLKDGYNVDPWIKFLDNLMENPSYRSREALYDFISHFNAPITEDGCFIAFKRLRNDFYDMYTGTIDNSPGQVVKMDRAKVDDDNKRTCSAGLHVCADEYLKGYATWDRGKTVAVKVNPRDVVSVPYDYNFSKMRTCQYEVIAEIQEKQVEEIKSKSYVDEGYW